MDEVKTQTWEEQQREKFVAEDKMRRSPANPVPVNETDPPRPATHANAFYLAGLLTQHPRGADWCITMVTLLEGSPARAIFRGVTPDELDAACRFLQDLREQRRR